VVAGYNSTGGQYLVEGNGLSALGSGFAWLDATAGGRTVVYCNGDSSNGFFYEVLLRRYANTDDRGGTRGTNASNSECRFTMVGSIMAGDPTPPPAHADTLQNYNPAPGLSVYTIRDSVLWSSWDKVIQGEYPGDNPIVIDNSEIIGPNDSSALHPQGSFAHNSANICITAIATVTNSTTWGSYNGPVTVKNSIIYGNGGSYTDLGGNTKPSTRPTPTPYPTDAQLDAIWSP